MRGSSMRATVRAAASGRRKRHRLPPMGKLGGEASAEIDAPIDEVWDVVVDIETAPDWQDGFEDVEVLERDDRGPRARRRDEERREGQDGQEPAAVHLRGAEPGRVDARRRATSSRWSAPGSSRTWATGARRRPTGSRATPGACWAWRSAARSRARSARSWSRAGRTSWRERIGASGSLRGAMPPAARALLWRRGGGGRRRAAPAAAANLRAGAGKADITPQHRLLPGRLDPRRPRRAGPAHAPVRADDRARARRSQGRARRDRPVHGPGRDGQADRRPAGRARVLRAEHPHLGVAHALGPGRLRELPDAQHRRAQPADRHRPRRRSSASSTPSRPTRSSTASSSSRSRSRSCAPTTTWARARGLGIGPHPRADRQPLDRGAPGEPRDHQGRAARAARPTTPAATSTRSTRPSTCCASTRSSRRGAQARRSVPIGAWSNFADHGTVTKSSFQYYNADHHGSATARLRGRRAQARARCARGQEIVNVYGNSNEGDMSAGLNRHGPAASDYVGRVEAAAMLRAWKRAGRAHVAPRPALDLRWTRMCFCGQETEGGRVADESQVGLPFLTGSEEERGPLFDVTGQHFEGQRAADRPRRPARVTSSSFPGVGTGGVPNRGAARSRCGSARGMIVTIPGEGTKEVGARIRSAVESQIAGSGIERVVMSGLAQRVRPLLHDARGVRAPALRGRQHALRHVVVEPAAPGAGDAGRPPRRAASPRRTRVAVRPDERRAAPTAEPTARAPSRHG